MLPGGGGSISLRQEGIASCHSKRLYTILTLLWSAELNFWFWSISFSWWHFPDLDIIFIFTAVTPHTSVWPRQHGEDFFWNKSQRNMKRLPPKKCASFENREKEEEKKFNQERETYVQVGEKFELRHAPLPPHAISKSHLAKEKFPAREKEPWNLETKRALSFISVRKASRAFFGRCSENHEEIYGNKQARKGQLRKVTLLSLPLSLAILEGHRRGRGIGLFHFYFLSISLHSSSFSFSWLRQTAAVYSYRLTRVSLAAFELRAQRSLQVSNSMVGFYFIVMVALLKQWCLFVG